MRERRGEGGSAGGIERDGFVKLGLEVGGGDKRCVDKSDLTTCIQEDGSGDAIDAELCGVFQLVKDADKNDFDLVAPRRQDRFDGAALRLHVHLLRRKGKDEQERTPGAWGGFCEVLQVATLFEDADGKAGNCDDAK